MMLMKTDPDEYDDHDLDALERAMVQVRKHGKTRRDQIDSKLLDEPWCNVAEFAAYVCQTRALKLKPWETPPIYGDICGAQGKAAELLQKMIAAGISRWEPDPIAALAGKRKRDA
jgi:hypothetical protein